jgi:glycosyltransferase involved in cell wall biosynthesis
MFLSRSPGPPMTGRKAVLNTAIGALREEGHDVDLFILAQPNSAPRCGSDGFWLGAVPKVRILCNAALSILGGTQSLNEALFRSPRYLAVARRLRPFYDFAVADTIRAAPYANELGVPWHLDLDDLLSRRYEQWLERPEQLSADLVLGYYRDSAPRVAAALPKAILWRLLKSEAACLRRREVYWARKATTVSLVSPDEAESFARIAGREVHSLPMSVHSPADGWRPHKGNGARPVFVGGLDYKPNLDALLYYQEQIFAVVKAMCGGAPTLDHIGNAPLHLRSKFAPTVVHFEGYVPDIVPRLRDASFFVAPIVSGTGIKTKVLDAMAVGLPVIATRHAVAGLRVEHGKHCFIGERPADFAEAMQCLRNPELAAKLGVEARKYVQSNFSMHVLRQRWSGVIHQLAVSQARREVRV